MYYISTNEQLLKLFRFFKELRRDIFKAILNVIRLKSQRRTSGNRALASTLNTQVRKLKVKDKTKRLEDAHGYFRHQMKILDKFSMVFELLCGLP